MLTAARATACVAPKRTIAARMNGCSVEIRAFCPRLSVCGAAMQAKTSRRRKSGSRRAASAARRVLTSLPPAPDRTLVAHCAAGGGERGGAPAPDRAGAGDLVVLDDREAA